MEMEGNEVKVKRRWREMKKREKRERNEGGIRKGTRKKTHVEE